MKLDNILKTRGLKNILNECYGVYDKVEEIDFDKLPNQFVLKDTLGSGGSSVIICKDKKNANLDEYRSIMREWVKSSTKNGGGREWVYAGRKHRIICEKYLNSNDGDLPDYKFFCFDGKMKNFYVRTNYTEHHDEGKMAFFDDNKQQLKGVGLDYCNRTDEKIELPNSINKMIEISEILSKEFPHCRVDLYILNNDIYFGELTFFTASGFFAFEPDEFDFILGKQFKLPYKLV